MNWQKHQTGFVPCRRKEQGIKFLYLFHYKLFHGTSQVLNSSEINFNLLVIFSILFEIDLASKNGCNFSKPKPGAIG
jgi:hypothetical protein